MWNYLTTPFSTHLPRRRDRRGRHGRNGETWRRLNVTFPTRIITHSSKQVFYFGADGLLRRLNYSFLRTAGKA